MRRRTFIAASGASLLPAAAGVAALGHWWFLAGRDDSSKSPICTLVLQKLSGAELSKKELQTVRSSRDSQLFSRILDGGTTTEATRPPFPEQEKIVYLGDIYELSYQITDETPGTAYSVKVDVPDTVVEDKAIQFADLPPVDQQKLASRGLHTGEAVGIGTGLVYTDAEREQSVLVPESEYSYITWADGTDAEWVADDPTDTTIHTYQYTATHIGTAADYGQQMQEQFSVALSGLPAPQKEILETAIDGRYAVQATEISDAYIALLDRFRVQNKLPGDYSDSPTLNGQYVVQYQGSVYWAKIRVPKPILEEHGLE